jgi:hypothetical protein
VRRNYILRVPGENICGYREAECDRMMGSVTKQEVFVICVLAKQQSYRIKLNSIVCGNDKYAQNLVSIRKRKFCLRTWDRWNGNTERDLKA